MSRLQHKILTRLKSSAATKRLAHGAGDNPLDAKRKELAEQVKDSSDKNRHFFAVYLGLTVYVLLMVFSTTDQMLLVPTQGIKLPLADIYMPLLGFYWSAPLFLLAIHFNLLQNLESHHYKLMLWKDACGGAVPREHLTVFLFDYEWLERGKRMEWLVRRGSRILFLHSGPFALGIVLWRFTDYQDIWITSWHLIAFVFDSYLVWQIRNAFEKNEEMDCSSSKRTALVRCRDWIRMIPARLREFFHNSPIYWLNYGLKIPFRLLKAFLRFFFTLWVLLQFGTLCLILSDFELPGLGRNWLSITNQKYAAQMIFIDPNEYAWLPEKKDIEAEALLAGQENAAQWWVSLGKGLDLSGRHLRGFSARGADLPKLKLDSNSELEWADLSYAQLSWAIMPGAQLQGANLSYAVLAGANLRDTRLQGADLRGTRLQGADLRGTRLQGADLSSADLRGVDLSGARLQGADLSNANLIGANLSGARLFGADLSGAALQGADLTGALLQGAIISNTTFQPLKLPEKETSEVVFNDLFFPLRYEWAEISGWAKYFPDEYSRGIYLQRVEAAKAQNTLTVEQRGYVLLNKPEWVWLSLIPAMDNESVDMYPQGRISSLAVARGLQRNYRKFYKIDEKTGWIPRGQKMTHRGIITKGGIEWVPIQYEHPEYYEKVNEAFCASKRFKSLCDPQLQAAVSAKAASGVPASTPADH